MSDSMLSGKVALITGAAHGLGLAIASAMAREGATLALFDMDWPTLEEVAGRMILDGRRVLPVKVDLRDVSEISDGIDRVVQELGRIDILVNNAGVIQIHDLEEVTLEEWDWIMGVNLRAVFAMSQAVGRVMLSQGGGAIVNIASIAGHTAFPDGSVYAVSKAAVRSLTEQIAIAWAPRNIRCNAVSPGLGSWFMTGAGGDPDVKVRQAARVPMRRTGDPDDFARVVVFLASDSASYINGETILVDGGLSRSLLTQLGVAERPA